MQTYLVTGGAGFIGSHFIKYLLRETDDIQVVNLDSLTYAGKLSNLEEAAGHPRYTFVQGDVRDGELVASLLREHDINCIVHLAAESHVDRSISDPAVFADTNVTGTLTLLQAALSAWRRPDGSWPPGHKFVYMSTDEVYGSIPHGRFTEQSPLCPRSPYSASKAAAELFVQAFRETHQLPAVILRSANNLGPNQHDEKLIPTVIRQAIRNNPIPIYGSGQQMRDWLPIPDSIRAIYAACTLGQPGEVYNISAGHERQNLALAEQIIQLLRASGTAVPDGLITHVADRQGHDFRYAMDASKLMRELNWQPTVDFTEYLRYTVVWYQQKYNAHE